jgi:4-hydroxy-tetrahydrodipicolinate synthase
MDVMPAAVTPFDAEGKVDAPGVARLLAYFRAEGATGVVVGGTTGEGPSLSGFEKRDLIRTAVPLAHGLPVWLGVATPSLEEAVWLAKEAGKAGAAGILLLPPFFHRDAHPAPWLLAVLDRSPVDVLLYNFPRFAPALTPDCLIDHPRLAGLKDSSGEEANLPLFAQALPGKRLFVGDETLIQEAIAAGWSGTISGAANVICRELAGALADEGESRATKLELLLPRLLDIRATPQPMGHKKTLVERGIIDRADVRLPL